MTSKRPLYLFFLTLQLISLQMVSMNGARAESFRIARPTEADKKAIEAADTSSAASQNSGASSSKSGADTEPPRLPGSTSEAVPVNVHKAAATVTDGGVQNSLYQPGQLIPASAYSTNAILDWQNRNMPKLQAQYNATMGDASVAKHHGLKSHIVGGAFGVIGTVANSYVPIRSVGMKGAPPGPPTITIEAGHCPAVNDPAFQRPATWWKDLSAEEGSPNLGPQWQLWLSAVRGVFQAHALELQETPGVANLHVILTPDGSIESVTQYSGGERSNPGYATSSSTMEHLHQIVLGVRRFPPFPLGTRVGRYHLIVGGAAN